MLIYEGIATRGEPKAKEIGCVVRTRPAVKTLVQVQGGTCLGTIQLWVIDEGYKALRPASIEFLGISGNLQTVPCPDGRCLQSPDSAISEAKVVTNVDPFEPSGSAMSLEAGKIVVSAGPGQSG
jgi:hypothetical protein